MDFLALAVGLGLLFTLFRWIERWLHQHIFKIGWLLSNSFQTTTVLYYIVFLPGIVLHEAVMWLAAGLLNVRAERAIGFPEPQEIGELRLNFIRIAEDTGRMKRLLVRLCPLAVGMAALWAIAAHVFQWEQLLALLADGSLEAWAAALATLTRTPDLWLWFYLAFVIANTMFPTLAARSDWREKAVVLVTMPLLTFAIWRLSNAANLELARNVESLLGSLGLIVGQIALVNVGAVLVLGTAEAIIERLSHRSATFHDGKMITLTREEAREFRLNQSRSSRQPEKAREKPGRPPVTSIYDLKLPIPGPPGREPISRSAAAVVVPATTARAPRRMEEALPAKSPSQLASPAATELEPPAADEVKEASIKPAGEGVDAPFDRPFSAAHSAGNLLQDWQEDRELDGAEPFARPFAMASRDDRAHTSEADDEIPLEPGESAGGTTAKRNPAQSVRQPSCTRPAPKPSQRNSRVSQQKQDAGADELEYEAFDDDGGLIDANSDDAR